MLIKQTYISLISSVIFLASCSSTTPDCTGINSWPAGSAFTKLKNEGILTNEMKHEETTVKRLNSEQIGPNLFKQSHLITFTKANGEKVEALTVNNASKEECSMSETEVFLLKKF